MTNLISFLKVVDIFDQLRNKADVTEIIINDYLLRWKESGLIDISFSGNKYGDYILDYNNNSYAIWLFEEQTWEFFDKDIIHQMILDLKEMDSTMFNLTYRGCDLEKSLDLSNNDFNHTFDEFRNYKFPQEWNIIK